MPKGHWYAPSSWYCTLPREERKGLLLFLFVKLSPGVQFATNRTWSTICYIHLYRAQSKIKIVVIRTLLWENTFAGHWETVVDCMENIGKCQQWLILPRNCLRTQLWFNQNLRSEQYSKSFNGSAILDRQSMISAVLHASLMPFLLDPVVPGVRSMGPVVSNWDMFWNRRTDGRTEELGILVVGYKWRHLVAKFATSASGAIWWSNLQLMQVASCGCLIKSQSRS